MVWQDLKMGGRTNRLVLWADSVENRKGNFLTCFSQDSAGWAWMVRESNGRTIDKGILSVDQQHVYR
jgi:hypothetical protein